MIAPTALHARLVRHVLRARAVLSSPGRDTAWLVPAVAIVLGALLRVLRLDESPSGFFCDEASAGYDAWSLWETARDQYGTFLPAFARSFGDWDEASYRYLAVPFVALLGPTVVATRLPAALAGLATIPLLHALVRRTHGDRAAALAALCLAVSPWHVLFSRIAFRGVLAPFALVLAVLLAVQARERPARWIGAGAAAALALWTYSPARVVVPALAVVIVALEWRRLSARARRPLALGAAIFAVALALLATFWTSPEGMARARSELRPALELEPTWDAYASYFDAPFLFGEGDPNLRHSPRGWGQLHLFEMLGVSLGLVVLALRRRRDDLLFAIWLVLAPVPAALTASEHALRAILAVPALAAISGIGLARLADLARRPRERALARALPVTALALAGLMLVRTVYVDYPRESAASWQWGMRELVLAMRRADRACRVVSDRFFLPHVFIAFFARVPPAEYQASPVTTITQHSRDLGDWQLAGWRVRPIARAIAEDRSCAYGAFTADAEAIAASDPDYELLRTYVVPGTTEGFVVFQLGQHHGAQADPERRAARR